MGVGSGTVLCQGWCHAELGDVGDQVASAVPHRREGGDELLQFGRLHVFEEQRQLQKINKKKVINKL